MPQKEAPTGTGVILGRRRYVQTILGLTLRSIFNKDPDFIFHVFTKMFVSFAKMSLFEPSAFENSGDCSNLCGRLCSIIYLISFCRTSSSAFKLQFRTAILAAFFCTDL
jgi:hypothetical protein